MENSAASSHIVAKVATETALGWILSEPVVNKSVDSPTNPNISESLVLFHISAVPQGFNDFDHKLRTF